MPQEIIEALRTVDQQLFTRLDERITAEALYRYLKPIADTHAPAQSVPWTRARVIEDLLIADGMLERKTTRYFRNYKNTGNAVYLLGEEDSRKDVWLLAHLDMITYLIEAGSEGKYELMPICYHLVEEGRREAVALRFDLKMMKYSIVAEGELISHGSGAPPEFRTDAKVALEPGTRVCLHSQMSWDKASGTVRGSLDDAGGAAALLHAATFLTEYEVELMLGLTDEEEGKVAAGNQSFGRGGARLLPHFSQPKLAIASDIHEAAEMYGGGGPEGFSLGGGASFAEKASKGVGAIVPPHLYEIQRQMAIELETVGIHLRENQGGYLSRTEGINAMLRTPNVALIGFLGENRHFQRDVESANIHDLVNLAKVVVCYSLLTKTSLWQRMVE